MSCQVHSMYLYILEHQIAISVFTHVRSFYLNIPVQDIKKRPHVDLWHHCTVRMTSPCRISAYSGFSGNLSHVFQQQNEVFSGEKEKESIIRVRMG